MFPKTLAIPQFRAPCSPISSPPVSPQNLVHWCFLPHWAFSQKLCFFFFAPNGLGDHLSVPQQNRMKKQTLCPNCVASLFWFWSRGMHPMLTPAFQLTSQLNDRPTDPNSPLKFSAQQAPATLPAQYCIAYLWIDFWSSQQLALQ